MKHAGFAVLAMLSAVYALAFEGLMLVATGVRRVTGK